MTRVNEEIQETTKIVFVFDFCSSTDILEDLHRTENVKKWRDLLIGIKEFLVKKSNEILFCPYNFTGDGWILLFDPDVNGKNLFAFARLLCCEYERIYRRKVLPFLETPPKIVGLTVGMDRGHLIKLLMNNRDEYIGRPLNVACRLQASVKERDPKYANKLQITKPLYTLIKKDVKDLKFIEVEKKLRNIAGGKKIHCMKLEKINQE